MNTPAADTNASMDTDSPQGKYSRFQKFQYVRSKKLLRAIAGLECQNCGRSGCTQAAHSNWAEHGKGRGIKASDAYCAALCVTCHTRLDQGKDWTREERQQIWGDAWRRTVRTLLARGEWPMDVPVPDIRQFNAGNKPPQVGLD